MTSSHRLRPGLVRAGSRRTLTGRAGTWTGPELGLAVLGCAYELSRRGVRAGERVLLKGENSPGYVVTLLALARLDASIVLVDHHQTASEGRRAAELARVRWLLYETEEDLGFPRAHAIRFPELISPTWPNRPAAPAPEVTVTRWWRRADAVVLWSSGTTGPAKGVIKSGRAILDNTLRTQRVMGYRPTDVLAPWLPFSHQYGLSMVLVWWLTGGTLAVTPYRRLDRAAAEVVQHRATVVDAPPATYHALLRLLERRPALREQLAGVRLWCVGGAPLPAPLAAAFRSAMGRPLLDGYGLTELGNVSLATPANPTGCGRPLPGVRVRVVGVGGRPAPAGTAGEIEVRSADRLAGYLDGAGALVAAPRRGWYRTNDLGYLDRAGNLHVIGRKQAIHRLGFTLYPESIERKAATLGRIVKVVAHDDPRRGSSLVFVVCDPDGGSPREWRQRLRALLPVQEHPNRVCVVDELPVTATGKVDLPQLREQAVAGYGRTSA